MTTLAGDWLRLKQVALVVTDLEPVVDQLRQIFDLRVAYRDPMVADFGLENAVLPVGEQFLEVVAPIAEATAAGRYLQRRNGPGGYMVITQCGDQEARRRQLAQLGVRTAFEFVEGGFSCWQLHPADTGGTFLEIDQQDGEGQWHPAGPDWRDAVSRAVVDAIVGVRLQCADPAAVARRWGSILAVEPAEGEGWLDLDHGRIAFDRPTDSRGDGLAALQVRAPHAERALAQAQTLGVRSAEREITLGGTIFELVGP